MYSLLLEQMATGALAEIRQPNWARRNNNFGEGETGGSFFCPRLYPNYFLPRELAGINLVSLHSVTNTRGDSLVFGMLFVPHPLAVKGKRGKLKRTI